MDLFRTRSMTPGSSGYLLLQYFFYLLLFTCLLRAHYKHEVVYPSLRGPALDFHNTVNYDEWEVDSEVHCEDIDLKAQAPPSWLRHCCLLMEMKSQKLNCNRMNPLRSWRKVPFRVQGRQSPSIKTSHIIENNITASPFTLVSIPKHGSKVI